MPIHITSECRHCGQAVEQGEDAFSMWFHSDRVNADEARKCYPSEPSSTFAIPKIEIRKRSSNEQQRPTE